MSADNKAVNLPTTPAQTAVAAAWKRHWDDRAAADANLTEVKRGANLTDALVHPVPPPQQGEDA